jgi:F-type H+-transporting ATPase subunit gamma
VGTFQLPNSVNSITTLVGQILVETKAHNIEYECNELYLIYNRKTLGSGYEPNSLRLLPLDKMWQSDLVKCQWPTNNLPEVMGNGDTTLKSFIREYLFVSIFKACTESLVSENASRLSAMQRADKNIEELLEDLNGTFHRLRQGSIDEELFDVVSGFEALSDESLTRKKI